MVRELSYDHHLLFSTFQWLYLKTEEIIMNILIQCLLFLQLAFIIIIFFFFDKLIPFLNYVRKSLDIVLYMYVA